MLGWTEPGDGYRIKSTLVGMMTRIQCRSRHEAFARWTRVSGRLSLRIILGDAVELGLNAQISVYNLWIPFESFTRSRK